MGLGALKNHAEFMLYVKNDRTLSDFYHNRRIKVRRVLEVILDYKFGYSFIRLTVMHQNFWPFQYFPLKLQGATFGAMNFMEEFKLCPT